MTLHFNDEVVYLTLRDLVPDCTVRVHGSSNNFRYAGLLSADRKTFFIVDQYSTLLEMDVYPTDEGYDLQQKYIWISECMRLPGEEGWII